jgi:hypothetical protein
MGEIRNEYKILLVESKETEHNEDIGIDGRKIFE